MTTTTNHQFYARSIHQYQTHMIGAALDTFGDFLYCLSHEDSHPLEVHPFWMNWAIAQHESFVNIMEDL